MNLKHVCHLFTENYVEKNQKTQLYRCGSASHPIISSLCSAFPHVGHLEVEFHFIESFHEFRVNNSNSQVSKVLNQRSLFTFCVRLILDIKGYWLFVAFNSLKRTT